MKRRIPFSIAWGCYTFVIYFIGSSHIKVADIVKCMSFGTLAFTPAAVGELMIAYLPILFLHLSFGTEIYRHFCTSSIYYFMRFPNKKRWYATELVKFVRDIFVIVSLGIGSVIALSISFGRIREMTLADIVLLLYFIISFSCFIIITSLIINLISILWNTTLAFSLVEAFNICSLGYYICLWDIYSEEYVMGHQALIRYDFVTNIMIGIHSSKSEEVNTLINKYGYSYLLSESLFNLFITMIVIMIIGGIIINRTDIMGERMEG